MAVAAHPSLSNASHATHLPSSWTTLYALSRHSEEEVETAFRNHRIAPDMKREEAERLLGRLRRPVGHEARLDQMAEARRDVHDRAAVAFEHVRDRGTREVLDPRLPSSNPVGRPNPRRVGIPNRRGAIRFR